VTDSLTPIRDWLFRALTFEAEAERFRSAGIRLGADQTDVEVRLMEEILTPFPVELRERAMRMTRSYALLYCFENSIRQLIRERMLERHGDGWWGAKVPKKVRDYAQRITEQNEKNTWLEGELGDALDRVLFGHLADIITNSWDDFDDLIPSQHWIRQRMDELEEARNYLAHNRMLLSPEFRRIEAYVGDWNRQVGV
jgi:hypothetical protein